MRKLKTFVAVLMLVLVLGLAAPQALAGDVQTPGVVSDPTPGQIETLGATNDAGDLVAPGPSRSLIAILFWIFWSG
jgi:hypothetical protein